MSPQKSHRLLRVFAGAAATAILVSSCAAGTDGGGSTEATITTLNDGMVNAGEEPGDPKDGGTLEFGAFSEPTSLDPAKTIPAVTTGGIELVNIYDSLMRFDSESGTEVPQLAEALTPDEDYRTWTLTLRDKVAFSNGTPVDAAAVKASQERYAAASGPDAALWKGNVVDIATPDDKTVVYTLDKPWPKFSNTLTSGAGMIVAEEAGAPGDGFTPIGAGPFTLDKWEQGTSMTLTANADYWDGKPYLDGVKISYIPTTNTAMETMFNGGIDMTYVRFPEDVQQMLDRGLPGYVGMTAAANVSLINAGPGRAGSDPRIRKAMQLALDPELVAERAYGNTAFAETELFAEYSRWHTDVMTPAHDPEAARKLVEAAKADGFDGKLVYVNGPSVEKQQQALSVQAQLGAVGIDVELQNFPTTGDQIRRIAVDKDYDLGGWGVSLREADPFPKLSAAMHSGGQQVYGMYTSPEMDSLIDQFQTDADDAAKLETMADIQRQLNEDVPFLNHGYYPEYVAWQKGVHGVQGTSNSMVMFGKAWKD